MYPIDIYGFDANDTTYKTDGYMNFSFYWPKAYIEFTRMMLSSGIADKNLCANIRTIFSVLGIYGSNKTYPARGMFTTYRDTDPGQKVPELISVLYCPAIVVDDIGVTLIGMMINGRVRPIYKESSDMPGYCTLLTDDQIFSRERTIVDVSITEYTKNDLDLG